LEAEAEAWGKQGREHLGNPERVSEQVLRMNKRSAFAGIPQLEDGTAGIRA